MSNPGISQGPQRFSDSVFPVACASQRNEATLVQAASLKELANAVAPVIGRLNRLSKAFRWRDGSSFFAGYLPWNDEQLIRISTAVRFLKMVQNVPEFVDEESKLAASGKLFTQQFSLLADRALPALEVLRNTDARHAVTITAKAMEQVVRSNMGAPLSASERSANDSLHWCCGKLCGSISVWGANNLDRLAEFHKQLAGLLQECKAEDGFDLRGFIALQVALCDIPAGEAEIRVPNLLRTNAM